MLSVLLKRGVRRGFLTLRRERGWMTSLGVMLGMLVVAQLLVMLAFGVQGVHRLLQAQTDLRLQVKDEAGDRDVQEFLIMLRDQSFVEQVTYITKEQAYEREKAKNVQLIEFLEEFSVENPFPDTIAVRINSLRDYDAFAAFTRQERWANAIDPAFLSQVTDQEREVHALLRLTSAGRSLSIGFLVLVAGVLLFVLTDLVRHRSLQRSEEIFVERLFGAKEAAVLIPFATEAMALMLMALLGSAMMLVVLLGAVPAFVPALAEGGSIAPLRREIGALVGTYAPLIAVLEVLLIPVLAAGGAWIGMRKRSV